MPVEDTVGAIADMVKAGYLSCVGLSEAGARYPAPTMADLDSEKR